MTAPRIWRTALLAALGVPLWGVAAEQPLFTVLSNREAWKHLPPTVAGDRGGTLPIWARILARPLPSTTAAMLEMDYLQRAGTPLDPALRAKIRWVAARANGSRYAEACAQADLIQAGGAAEELTLISSSPERLSDKERRTFAFARRLCEAAYEVTDADIAELLSDWGAEQLTAIVLTVAYANCQDRMFQALGIEAEAGDDLLPPNLRFDWEALEKKPLAAPARMVPEPPGTAEVPLRVDDAAWQAAPLEELRVRLGSQKLRSPRIPIPPDEVVERNTPAGFYPPGRAHLIKWNCITYGYQPQLTHAWFVTLRRFRGESALAADFRQSVFWVVTRANMCFY